MKNLIICVILSFSFSNSICQKIYTVEFVKSSDTIQKDLSKAQNYKYLNEASNFSSDDTADDGTLDYKIDVEIDLSHSSLAATEYNLDFRPTTLQQLKVLKNYPFYLTINKDTLPDRAKTLILILRITDKENKVVSSKNSNDTMKITVEGSDLENDSLRNYQYLAYIGTNFDLVDGVKANNLFFATNIFLPPPQNKKGWGMYLSLYGNRAMTATDTLTSIRDYKREKINDSITAFYREQATSVKTMVSDNIGAYISGLVKLGKVSHERNKVQLYYSPSLEFVWRRTQISSLFKDGIPLDTTIKQTPSNFSIVYPNSFVANINEFNFKVGVLGFFIRHENKNISIRVHGCTGYSSAYLPLGSTSLTSENTYTSKADIFFTGRAWITEASSGVTLQAEIVNYLINPKPMYVVTLSKAIEFGKIGNLFQPLTR